MTTQPRDPYSNQNKKNGSSKAKKKSKTTSLTKVSKGFGALKVSNKTVNWQGSPLEDPETVAFFDFMTSNGAECSKVCLASFGGLRGIMALEDIQPGETVMAVPYELCLDLGAETADPTLPALAFHQKFVDKESKARPYLNKIPTVDSGDCTTTDFFNEEELAMLQCPNIVAETKKREARLRGRVEALAARSEDNESPPVTLDELRWATWVVVSRVLTVQSSNPDVATKCLIPLIDMVNHHPVKGPPQVLSGRAAPGSFMKIIAGPQGIKAGEQVFIEYGGGQIGSARFLQDYGFLDARAARKADAGFVRYILSDADRDALAQTSIAEDHALLLQFDSDSVGGSGVLGSDGEAGALLSPCAALAVGLRINLKEALQATAAAEAKQRRVTFEPPPP